MCVRSVVSFVYAILSKDQGRQGEQAGRGDREDREDREGRQAGRTLRYKK